MALNKVKERPWSDLPSDILSLIQSHLFGRDYVHFLAVCRAWRLVQPTLRQIPHPASEVIPYPYLLYFWGNNSLCNVFNPVYNSTSSIDIPELTGARIHYSKDGWLLMSQEIQVFFFHPFTKQIINLPKLPDKDHYYFNKMSFSSPPTSLDCVVFGIVDVYELAVEISFIRRGEDSWTSFTRRYDKDKSFHAFNSNPVYHNGAFYSLSREGTLGIFDPKKRGKLRWMLLYTSGHPREPTQENYLVECNGELVSVLVGHLGDYVSVYKFNREMKAWKEVKNLGDNTIFVSLSTSVSVTSSSLQVQGMENKVYFPRFNGRNGVFYSLATSKFHSFGYTAEDLYNTRHPLHCTWIIPNFQLCTDEELDWISIPENEKVWHPNPKEFSVEYIQNLSFVSNSSYRRSIKAIEEKRAPRAQPWLVVCHGPHEKCHEKQIFFNMLEDQYYVRSIPELNQKRIATWSYGWLVLVDLYSNDCFLLNPISMEKIHLPPREESFCYDLCVLTSSPNHPNCIVLFIENCQEEDKFMYCWLGDDKWTIKTTPVGPVSGRIGGAVSFGGKIYGLTHGYREFVMIDINPTLTIRQVGEDLPRALFRGAWCCNMSLVESCDELFALTKLFYGNAEPSIVMDIEVHKMDFSRMKWERVKSLGDQAFFWSHSNLTSCSATESGIKGNTIYFTESEDISLYAFDLKDGSISISLPFPNVKSDRYVKSRWSQPAWAGCLV